MSILNAPVKQILVAGDGSVRPLANFQIMVQEVRKNYPGGVDLVLIGLAASPGYKVVKTRNGIIAILIGLLLPAVQRIASPNSADLVVLKGAVNASKGSINVLLADGSVRFVSGKPISGYIAEEVIVSS
jgi:prepilin-type processing-associated H-X9-DG protein